MFKFFSKFHLFSFFFSASSESFFYVIPNRHEIMVLFECLSFSLQNNRKLWKVQSTPVPKSWSFSQQASQLKINPKAWTFHYKVTFLKVIQCANKNELAISKCIWFLTLLWRLGILGSHLVQIKKGMENCKIHLGFHFFYIKKKTTYILFPFSDSFKFYVFSNTTCPLC